MRTFHLLSRLRFVTKAVRGGFDLSRLCFSTSESHEKVHQYLLQVVKQQLEVGKEKQKEDQNGKNSRFGLVSQI